MAMAQCTVTSAEAEPFTLLEVDFLKKVEADPEMRPLKHDGVAEKFAFPAPPKKDEPKEAHEAFLGKKQAYQTHWNAEMLNFVEDRESPFYLALQPLWNCQSRALSGLEVLCRVANGKDDAPMPGLATFQADPAQKGVARQFLEKQIEFALDVCRQLPVRISVNVRPDELAGVKDLLLAKAVQNLVIEITEYSPIDEEFLHLVREMKDGGVVFSMDDVTEVQDTPGKGMAPPSHACSMELSKRTADLWDIQKLALPMSCSVFRSHVYTTPQYDGGTAQPFLKGMIFPLEQMDEIVKRKELVEDWVTEVSNRNPNVKFVIECTVYSEDLQPPDLFPQIDLLGGQFDIQGGRSGGRAFPLKAFLPQ